MASRKDMEILAMNLYKQQMIEKNDSLIADALNQVASENIMLKNTIQQLKLQNLKDQTIDNGRTKPVDLSKRRSGKRKGGTI